MINGNKKGKIGEREWRDRLRENGYDDARRGQQFSGSPDSPDVVCKTLEYIHFEVKRVEALNIGHAMKQAVADCGGKTPVVAHRKNGEDWLITMEESTFFWFLRHAHFFKNAAGKELEGG
jgi:Holliday junction resolvase